MSCNLEYIQVEKRQTCRKGLLSFTDVVFMNCGNFDESGDGGSLYAKVQNAVMYRVSFINSSAESIGGGVFFEIAKGIDLKNICFDSCQSKDSSPAMIVFFPKESGDDFEMSFVSCSRCFGSPETLALNAGLEFDDHEMSNINLSKTDSNTNQKELSPRFAGMKVNLGPAFFKYWTFNDNFNQDKTFSLAGNGRKKKEMKKCNFLNNSNTFLFFTERSIDLEWCHARYTNPEYRFSNLNTDVFWRNCRLNGTFAPGIILPHNFFMGNRSFSMFPLKNVQEKCLWDISHEYDFDQSQSAQYLILQIGLLIFPISDDD